MRVPLLCSASLAAALLLPVTPFALADDAPKSWIDADTGHRVIRLTDDPGTASMYFNQNGYTADRKKLVYTSSKGIWTMNLAGDLASQTSRLVVAGRVRLIEAGRKTPNVYYIKDGAVWSTNAETGDTREIGKLPVRGSVSTVNADETLVAGTYTETAPETPAGRAPNQYAQPPQPGQQAQSLDQPVNKGQMMEERLAARIPMAMFTMSIQTGEVRVIHRATDWLNHLLFSPTDPTLLMYCHEGPWHKLDRLWTIRTDSGTITKIHTRTMAMEIFGHEFWSADGKTIYYDLQTPRGEDFWLATYNVESGARKWYHLQRNEWSIHFNVAPDEALYCGDGGDPGQVAHAPDGQWIYLFRPQSRRNEGPENKDLIQTGVLQAEKLVNMSKHQYRLEPNVSFSPDRKWVVFRSNMLGPTYVFAVEVEKAEKTSAAAR